MSTTYLAGLFDGEGSIGVYRCRTPSGFTYRATFTIAGAYRPAFAHMVTEFPGAILHRERRRVDRPTHKTKWVLRINKKAAILDALKRMRPYLWEKRAQASVVIDYLDGRITGPCASDMCKELKTFDFDGEGRWQA